MSRPRYWLAGTLTACCLAVAANAQIVSQVVNTVAVSGIVGLGTSVATALGINVGTTGAVLVKGTSVCADLSNATGACSATYVAPTTWTPTDASGASLVFTGVSANYTRIGNMVFAYTQFIYPATADGSSAAITGLPVTVANADYAGQCSITFANSATFRQALPIKNTSSVNFYNISSLTRTTNAQLSTTQVNLMCIYPAT